MSEFSPGAVRKKEVDVLCSPVPNSPYGLCGHKATLKKKKKSRGQRRSELRERGSGRPWHPIPNSKDYNYIIVADSLYGLCGRKATKKKKKKKKKRLRVRAQKLRERKRWTSSVHPSLTLRTVLRT